LICCVYVFQQAFGIISRYLLKLYRSLSRYLLVPTFYKYALTVNR
jgi:hypothetical protein